MTKEEAIRRIKSWNLDSDDMEVLSVVIPELAESEDEKFQKYILKVCKECVEANDKGLELSMSTTKKLLSYLEKQKEKMTAEEYEKSELFQLKLKTQYANGYQDGLVQKEQSITVNDLDEEVHRFFDDCIDVHETKLYGNISERVIPLVCYELTARHFAKWGEKRKEQKPSESCDGICCGAKKEEIKKYLKDNLRMEWECHSDGNYYMVLKVAGEKICQLNFGEGY